MLDRWDHSMGYPGQGDDPSHLSDTSTGAGELRLRGVIFEDDK